jgi:hypothetical protein
MRKEQASNLVSELQIQYPFFPVPRESFVQALSEINVPESSKFCYEPPTPIAATVEQTDLFYVFSLRRILRNNRAQLPVLDFVKRARDSVSHFFVDYSSTELARKLRRNKIIRKLIQKSGERGNPYSLLGKLETFETGDQSTWITTLPIIVVPGLRGMGKRTLQSWMQKHKRIEKEYSSYFHIQGKNYSPTAASSS